MNKTVENLMDKHLSKIQKEFNGELKNFEKSGVIIDETFIQHFLKVSYERMEQTCERYQAEGQWRTPQKHPNVNTEVPAQSSMTALRSNLTNITKKITPTKRKFGKGNTDGAKQQKQMKPKQSDGAVGNGSQKNSIVFYCHHCLNTNNSMDPLLFTTIEDFYEHWFIKHYHHSMSKPFLIRALPLVRCFYCNEIGTYNKLVDHHTENHSDVSFTIVDLINDKKCGICHYRNGNMIEHFKAMHKTIPKIFNPIYYSDELIAQLLKINIKEKRQCTKCNLTFKTEDEVVEHNSNSHGGQVIEPMNMNSIVNQTAWDYFICGHCQQKGERSSYLRHFNTHAYNFKCSRCKYESSNLTDLMLHDKNVHNIDSIDHYYSSFPKWAITQHLNTKIVFRQGLVLKNYNLLGTNFDDKSFEDFIRAYLDAKKECLEKMIKMSAENPNKVQNQSQFQTDIDLDDISNRAELNKQMKLNDNFFYIGGLVNGLKSCDLRKIITKLCRKLKIMINVETDVKYIEFCGKSGLTVGLHNPKLKNLIWSELRKKTIWSNEIFKLYGNEKPQKIYVEYQMTPFYADLVSLALNLSRENKIHSYWMSETGLMVRRRENEAAQIFLSEKQLFEHAQMQT